MGMCHFQQLHSKWIAKYVTFGPLKVPILLMVNFNFIFFHLSGVACALSHLSLQLSLFCIAALVQGGHFFCQ